MQIPETSLVVRRKEDGYHSILLNGVEIGGGNPKRASGLLDLPVVLLAKPVSDHVRQAAEAIQDATGTPPVRTRNALASTTPELLRQ